MRYHYHATGRKFTITSLPRSRFANMGVLLPDSHRLTTSTFISDSLSESCFSLLHVFLIFCLAFCRRNAFFSRRSITSLTSPSYCSRSAPLSSPQISGNRNLPSWSLWNLLICEGSGRTRLQKIQRGACSVSLASSVAVSEDEEEMEEG